MKYPFLILKTKLSLSCKKIGCVDVADSCKNFDDLLVFKCICTLKSSLCQSYFKVDIEKSLYLVMSITSARFLLQSPHDSDFWDDKEF